MRKLMTLAAVLLFSSLLRAQDFPRYEVFGGYSLQHDDAGITSHGWEASAGYNFNRWLGLRGDFSGHYYSTFAPAVDVAVSSDVKIHDFLFGPQLSWRTNRVTLSGHSLFGVSHVGVFQKSQLFVPLPPVAFHQSDNSFAAMLGGGVDLNLTQHLGWRVGQLDYFTNAPFGSRHNDFRFATGLVFRFGK